MRFGNRPWILSSVLLILVAGSPPLLAQPRNVVVGRAEAAANEQRVALVIGNANYKESALRNPVNDAADVAAKLKSLGFEVTLRTNTTQKEMTRAITLFGERLKPGSVALFYYAGHGIQARGRNFLVPIDAEIKGEAAVRSEAVDVDQLLDQLAPARVSMVILDACRNNPFERRFRSGAGAGLAQIDAPKGSFIAYATAPGKVAADGTGRNGLYTQELLKAMDQPNLKVEDLFKQVRINVSEKSKDRQIPWEASSLTGDFYFKSPAGAQVAAMAPLPAAPSAPAGGGVSLDDLREQQASRAQWAKWQAGMKADFDKILALNAAPDLQAAAWERFLGGYAQDNPYSGEDAELRTQALQKKQAAEAASARQKEEAESKRRAAAQVALAPASTSAIQYAAPASTISAAAVGRSFRDCDVCPEMVVIPAGSFVMGSPASEPQRDSDEGPQHQVTISRAFAAGKYEVTFDEWDACVHESGCSTQATDQGWGRGRRPVINVSWNDAKQYTAWLSRKTGKSYRLLSEAEWEYAARAGTSTVFAFGNSITPQQANYDSKVSYAGGPTATDQGKTVPVGSYPANAFGLYDMHGNVWEWTEDCHNDSYSGAPTDGSAWTAGDCGLRVLRGGSWDDGPWNLRSADRGGDGPAGSAAAGSASPGQIDLSPAS